jgi:hypothetical protein
MFVIVQALERLENFFVILRSNPFTVIGYGKNHIVLFLAGTDLQF